MCVRACVHMHTQFTYQKQYIRIFIQQAQCSIYSNQCILISSYTQTERMETEQTETKQTDTTDGAAYSVSETTIVATATTRKRPLKEVDALLLLPVKSPVLHLFDVQHCEHSYNTATQTDNRVYGFMCNRSLFGYRSKYLHIYKNYFENSS